MPVRDSGAFARGRLPHPVDDMVGRQVEIDRVVELLRGNRLVTLTGTGGIGKTRLALEVARSAVASFAEEAWLVELVEVNDPGLVGQAIASALGLTDPQGAGAEEVLVEALVDRQVLLVLDNCEHLLDRTATLVERLLTRCERLRVLVTSREWLRVRGEATFEVPTLGLPGDSTRRARPVPGQSVGDGPAVELFTRRAVEVAPGFTLGEGNRDAVDQIVSRLDGLPLAIELAAARLRTLSIGELAERLSDRYRVLSGSRRGAVPHHQTMRMCVDWSYEQCSHLEQLLWKRASVFVGSFDLDAVESVCGFGALDPAMAVDLVTGLVDKSVLMRADRVSGETSSDGARFRLLETLREYGRERLRADGEEDQVLDRHRAYYTELVAATSEESSEVVDHDWPGWRRLDLELPNLRLMLDPDHASHRTSAPSLRTCRQLRVYWYTRGFFAEARRHYERALAADTTPSRDRVMVLAAAAGVARSQGDDTWKDWIDQLVADASASGDRLSGAIAQHSLAVRLLFSARPAEAIKGLQSAAAVFAEEGDELRHFASLIELHTAAVFSGDAALAERVYGEAVEIADQRSGGTRFFLDLDHALIKMATGERDEAVRLELNSLRHFAAAGHRAGTAYALEALALIMHSAARVELAVLALGAARQRNEQLGAHPALLTQFGDAFEALEKDGRAQLGSDGFEETIQTGARQLDSELIAAIGGDPAQETTDAGRRNILTPRELDVAALVADGLTNRAIGERLFITPRTVRGHIENMTTKLGMYNRTQIAAWYAAHRSAPNPSA